MTQNPFKDKNEKFLKLLDETALPKKKRPYERSLRWSKKFVVNAEGKLVPQVHHNTKKISTD